MGLINDIDDKIGLSERTDIAKYNKSKECIVFTVCITFMSLSFKHLFVIVNTVS